MEDRELVQRCINAGMTLPESEGTVTETAYSMQEPVKPWWKERIKALERENAAYKSALEYILILHNLYLGGDFKSEPDGSNAKHLSSIAYQMVDTAEGALQFSRRASTDGEQTEKETKA